MFVEVRNDYVFEKRESGIKSGITIDAWRTGNDNEEGVVVATVILTEHNDIVVAWHDNGARMDEMCINAIEDAVKRLRDTADETTI